MTCRRHIDKTKFTTLLIGLISLGTLRAEPDVDAKELPRIAPTEAEDALTTFALVPGYKLELVAAEPLVADPIAMAFDQKSRLFVVEMRGYSERRDEKLGRIRLLSDDDGDGKFDRSTIYAEDLAWPTAVIAWQGGIFVAATPDIFYLKDDDGDGVADSKSRVFTGFGAGIPRLNVQALVNNLKWGPDGRIHGATAGNGGRVYRIGDEDRAITELRGLDFSFDPATLDFRAENGGGQYGLCFDEGGRKFVCSNSNHIQQIMYARRYAGSPLPPARTGIASDGPAAEVFRLSGEEPWRVVRTRWRVAGQVKGPVEGGGRVSGYFTAATGIEIHRGDAFICDAGSNLIHRKTLTRKRGDFQLDAMRPTSENRIEFLASSDNWFRPVQLLSGPDGALYIADMYREVIEHPWSLPASIKKHLDLNSGNERGRIYRIVPDNFVQASAVDLGQLGNRELITHLGHHDHKLALRVLYGRRDPAILPMLNEYLNAGSPEGARAAAVLQLIADLGGMDELSLLRALSSRQLETRRQAIVLSESLDPLPEKVRANLATLAGDPDPEIRYQLALTLGLRTGEWRIPILAEILAAPSNRWTRSAVLKALGSSAGAAFEALSQSPSPPPRGAAHLLALAAMVGESGDAGEIAKVRQFASKSSDYKFQLLAALAGGQTEATWIQHLSGTVGEHAASPSASIPERIAAIQLHGLIFDKEPATLRRLLEEPDFSEITDAIAETLQHWDSAESANLMITHWERFSPQGKRHATNAMLGEVRAPILLNAIKQGKIPIHAIDGATVDQLQGHESPITRKLANSLFDDSFGVQAKIEKYSNALKLEGDPGEGRMIFLGRCSTCHRAGEDGFAYGPDVASFRTAGRESILTNIIDPNREVAPQYAAHEIRLKDGRRLAGRITQQDDQRLQLAFPAGIHQEIKRMQIATITPLPHSPMPERLETGLSRQQMADLLEFLTAGE